jgi:hypothetical protein
VNDDRAEAAAVRAYGALCALFHDAAQPSAPDAEVDWYASRLPGDAGPLLEPLCGTGRLLLPLLQRDLNVHGVDASAAMLARCGERLAAAGLGTTLMRQDIAWLNLPFRYGAAFIAAGSLQVLADQASAQTALERIRAHLLGPGELLLDLFVPGIGLRPPGAPVVEVRSVGLSDGSRITVRSETFVDAAGRRLDTRSRYERRVGARIIGREDERTALTWYTQDDAVALLRDAGYRDIEIEDPPLPAASGNERFAVSARA